MTPDAAPRDASPSKLTARDAVIAVLLGIALVALLLPAAHRKIDPHHDGIMLKPALDVLDGQVLFRDSFSQYGALSTYLQAAMLWFSPTLLCLRLTTVAAYVVILGLLYASWRLILPRTLTVVACLLFALFLPVYEKHWHHEYWPLVPWSSVYALLFQSLGIYAMFQIILHRRPGLSALLLGLACAATLWCRQPVGVIFTGCTVAIWIALWFSGWPSEAALKAGVPLRFLAGFFGANLLLLAGIFLSGAGPAWWYQNFQWPAKWASQGGGVVNWHDYIERFVHVRAGLELALMLAALALPSILRRFRPGLTRRSVVIYYVGLAALGAWQHERVLHVVQLRDGGWTALLPAVVTVQALLALVAVPRRPAAARPVEFYLVSALAAYALGSALQYLPVPDAWHILWAIAPAFGLFVYLLWRWSGWSAPALAGALAVLFVPAVIAKSRLAADLLAEPTVTLTSPAVLRGMKVSEDKARIYTQIESALTTLQAARPGVPAVMIGNDALYPCFLEDRTNLSPYYVTWPGVMPDEEHLKLWAAIHRLRPVLIMHQARWDAVGDFYRRERYVPLLYLEGAALEIAAPQELADKLGLKLYGLAPAKPGQPASP